MVGKQSVIDVCFVVGNDRRDVADVDERAGSCRGGSSDGVTGGGDDGVSVEVASRRARHPRVAGACVTRGYHRSVIITVRVYVGGRWSGRGLLMIRQPLLLLLAQHLVGKILDQGERLPSLVPHQAHGGLLHHVVQQHQVLILEGLLLGADKVIPQVVLEFCALLADVREIDEESRAHVPLQRLYVLGLRGFVHLDQKVAILEQTASANLFRTPRRDQFLVKMIQRLLEVAVHGFAYHGGIEIFADGQLAALVEQEERVEDDLERVDGKLELPPHRVDEFQIGRAHV